MKHLTLIGAFSGAPGGQAGYCDPATFCSCIISPRFSPAKKAGPDKEGPLRFRAAAARSFPSFPEPVSELRFHLRKIAMGGERLRIFLARTQKSIGKLHSLAGQFYAFVDYGYMASFDARLCAMTLQGYESGSLPASLQAFRTIMHLTPTRFATLSKCENCDSFVTSHLVAAG